MKIEVLLYSKNDNMGAPYQLKRNGDTLNWEPVLEWVIDNVCQPVEDMAYTLSLPKLEFSDDESIYYPNEVEGVKNVFSQKYKPIPFTLDDLNRIIY